MEAHSITMPACTSVTYSLWAGAGAATLCLAMVGTLGIILRRPDPSSSNVDEASKGGRERSAHLDNAKFLMMLGVTACHYLGLVRPMPLVDEVGRFGLPWAIRIFAFLSGIVARSPPSWRAFRSLAWRVGVPFLAFCTVLDSFLFQLFFEPFPTVIMNFPQQTWEKFINLRGAAGIAWYLQAMILWRLLGFAIHRLPACARVVLAVAASCFIGYFKLGDLDMLSVTHALQTWPMYVLGQVFPWDAVVARTPWSRATAFAGILALAVLFTLELLDTSGTRFIDVMPADQWGSNFHLREQLDFGWNEGSGPRWFCSFTEMGTFVFRALFRHAWEFCKGLILVFAVCPRSTTFFSTWGKFSLYPHMLQLFVLRLYTSIYPQMWPALLKDNYFSLWGATLSWILFWAMMVGLVGFLASWPIRPMVALFFDPCWLYDALAGLAARRVAVQPRPPATPAKGDVASKPTCDWTHDMLPVGAGAFEAKQSSDPKPEELATSLDHPPVPPV
eukprot:TRINITY_DN14371_c1_g1_i1.p1 TRINITY_DN14371_c1_g1~~TRINITY_DN14371_c1_g1_i1.p1  ORF type:complete len:502 (-),score=88.70 TRINITY_DN14371_c1_g1_i1:115-1620(-)